MHAQADKKVEKSAPIALALAKLFMMNRESTCYANYNSSKP
jgi:hypothetical protein